MNNVRGYCHEVVAVYDNVRAGYQVVVVVYDNVRGYCHEVVVALDIVSDVYRC